MKMNFSITELSSLTNKSRPTLYKYLDAYDLGAYDELPYSFIGLFDLLGKPGVARKDIVSYCESAFAKAESDPLLGEIIALLRQNKDRLDLIKIKQYITKEIRK